MSTTQKAIEFDWGEYDPEMKERFDCALHSALTFISKSPLTANDNVLHIMAERIPDLSEDDLGNMAFGFMLGVFFLTMVNQHDCKSCKAPKIHSVPSH